MQGLVDGHFRAELHQIRGRRQAAWTGANNGDPTQGLFEVKRLGLGGMRVVANKSLETADRHRFHLGLDEHTLGLALAFLGADPTADGGEDAGFMNRCHGGVKIAHQQVADEARNIDADRTARDAGRNDALNAAFSFSQCGGVVVTQVDFRESAGAFQRVTFGHLDLVAFQRRVLLVGSLALDEQLFFQAADVGCVRIGLDFLFFEAFLARMQFPEIHLVAIEVGTVNTSKLDLAVHRDTAGAAHARAIHHDGVERHHGFDAIGAGGVHTSVHHGHGSDGNHHRGLLRIKQVLQSRRHKAGPARAAIVCANNQLVAELGQFVGPEHEILAAKTDDTGGAVARLLEGAQLREDRRHAQATTHQHHMAELVNVLRQAQRADEITKAVALLVLVAHLARGLAQGLNHDGDGATLAVKVGDGERNALSVVVQTQHHKMSGLRRRSHIWRKNFPQKGVLGEYFSTNYGVHRVFLGRGSKARVPGVRSRSNRQSGVVPSPRRLGAGSWIRSPWCAWD